MVILFNRQSNESVRGRLGGVAVRMGGSSGTGLDQYEMLWFFELAASEALVRYTDDHGPIKTRDPTPRACICVERACFRPKL